MDTSKEYIKMCDCPEAQIEGYITLTSRKEIQYVGDDVFAELDMSTSNWRSIRLLRQSQIQEMMGGDKGTFCDWLLRLEEFTHIVQPWDISVNKSGLKTIGWLQTWEQLWLAFYMHEKHEKIWDGEKWVKSE